MPASGPKRISDDRLKKALKKHAGIYSMAARELGCHRTNITYRVGKSPELQEFVASLEADIDDLAQAIVVDTLGRREFGRPTKEAQAMARWLKDFRVRASGQRFRLEHTGKDGAPLPAAPLLVEIVYVDAQAVPADEDIPI